MKKIAFLILSLSAVSASADQCAWLSHHDAWQAKKRIQESDTIYDYCEPCGDVRPREVRVHSVRVQDYGDHSGVLVNGQEIDLAYIFVPESCGYYKNLAKAVGCPATDVSEYIKPEDCRR